MSNNVSRTEVVLTSHDDDDVIIDKRLMNSYCLYDTVCRSTVHVNTVESILWFGEPFTFCEF